MEILLKGLRAYLLKYKWHIFAGTVFIIISNFFSIYPAQVVRLALDLVGDLLRLRTLTAGFQYADRLTELTGRAVLAFGGVVLLLALLRGVFLFYVRQMLIVTSRKIEYEQKNEIYAHFQRLTLKILRKRQTGDLMARISEDVGNVRMFTGPGVMYTINTITLFFMVLITMLYVNVELTLYVLTPLPALGFAIYYVNSIIIKRSEEQQRQLSVLTSLAQESFAGIRLLKAYARENHFAEKFEQESGVYRQKALRLSKIDALFFPSMMVLVGLSSIFTVWIGGEKVISGTLSIGNIAEFVIYVNLLVWPIAAMGWVTSLTQKAAASQLRIEEALSWTPEIIFPESSPSVNAPSYRLENVSFQYDDAPHEVLSDLNIEITAGSTVGIVGATGSGKTTLANLLVRQIDPSKGVILLDGRDMKSYSETALRESIAFVPQDVFLFSDTIRGNIAFGKFDATEEEIIDAAQFAGVYEDILHFPDGFNTIVGERGVTLSGGQKQRLSIARAYLRRAPVFVLDDALSAVDTRTEEIILQNLQSAVKGAYRPTLIIITHRLSAVYNADKIIVLKDGKVVEQGVHTNLLSQNGVYAGLHRRQQIEAELAL